MAWTQLGSMRQYTRTYDQHNAHHACGSAWPAGLEVTARLMSGVWMVQLLQGKKEYACAKFQMYKIMGSVYVARQKLKAPKQAPGLERKLRESWLECRRWCRQR